MSSTKNKELEKEQPITLHCLRCKAKLTPEDLDRIRKPNQMKVCQDCKDYLDVKLEEWGPIMKKFKF